MVVSFYVVLVKVCIKELSSGRYDCTISSTAVVRDDNNLP